MGFDAWLTLGITVVTVAGMLRGLAPPSVALLGAAVVLMAAGVTEPREALAGFSNPAPFTVGALLVVARAVHETGALSPVLTAMLGGGGNFLRAGVRLLAPTAAASAFLSNTSIVAILTPAVSEWSARQGTSASRYLMPLSFAAVLGGTMTVLGTTTNVAVAGLVEDAGMAPIGLFEVAKLGLPLTVAGLVVMIAVAPLVLPQRTGPRENLAASREYTVEMVVEPGGPLDGAEVESGGLRSLSGVYLVQLERPGYTIAPVSPRTVLRGDDRLRFVGRVDDVVDLHGIEGLRSGEDGQLAELGADSGVIYEAVLGQSSPVIGQTIRGSEFRGRYQAAVLAVHRAGRRIDAKLGDVRMRVGDTLLLISDDDFEGQWGEQPDFLLVSGAGKLTPRGMHRRQAMVVIPIVVAMVALAGTGVLTIVEAALLAALGVVASRVLTPAQARAAIDLDVVVTIAAAFGLAAAIRESGLADEFAMRIVDGFESLGPRGVLLAIVLATLVLTELVTNSAAAVLMFPVAVAAAEATGLDPRAVAIAVAITASASFLTPIGYQTNLMVYGPGGYRFLDYARLGAPLSLTVIVVLVLATPVFW